MMRFQSLKGGYFGINIKDRTARFYDDGNTRASTTTLSYVGKAVAKLLSLPSEQLETHRNKFVYVQSFCVSQNQMLSSVCKATGSSESEWVITKVPVDEAIASGRKEVESGNYRGMIDMGYGTSFKPGAGGDYEKRIDNGALGLEEEDLDEVVKGIVEGMEGEQPAA